MAAYQLTAGSAVLRVADGAFVPSDPLNRDWIAYQGWLDAGNTPDPAPPPPASYVPPTPRQWLERLSPATQAAIASGATANPAVLLWVLKATGNPSIDVAAAETIAGVGALEAAGIITTEEQMALLAP